MLKRRKELSVFVGITRTALEELLYLHRRECFSVSRLDELLKFGVVEVHGSAPVVTELGQKVAELYSPDHIMDDLVRHTQAMLQAWKANARASDAALYKLQNELKEKMSRRYLGYRISICSVECGAQEQLGSYRVSYTKRVDGCIYSGHVWVLCRLRRSNENETPPLPKAAEELPPEPPPSKGSPYAQMSQERLEKEIYRSQLHGLGGSQAKNAWFSTIEIHHQKGRTSGG